MKIQISLSAIKNIQAEEVLRRIASTVNKKYAKYKVDNDYSFDGKLSCYGAVADYIKKHITNIPATYIIYLYTSNVTQDDADDVTHACMYDHNGKKIVDTFPGHPAISESGIAYYALPNVRFPDATPTELRMILNVTLRDFFLHYFRQD